MVGVIVDKNKVRVFEKMPEHLPFKGEIFETKLLTEEKLFEMGIRPILKEELKFGEIYLESLSVEDLVNGVFIWKKRMLSKEELSKKLDQDLKDETNKYLKRAEDGALLYAKLSAEFRLAKKNGFISEEDQIEKERILIPLRNEVLAGQWISAKQLLIELGQESIGKSLYDRLLEILNTYIDENY